MTIKDKIKAVLTDTKANFQAGAALYSMLGDNPNLKDVFQRKAKRKKREPRIIQKLEYCLKQILKSLPTDQIHQTTDQLTPQIVIKAVSRQPSAVSRVGSIPFDAPEPVKKLHQSYILLAREEIQLHGRLFPEVGLSTDKCYDICVKIMDIKKEQDKIWNNIRKWKTTGEIPVVTSSGFKEGFEAAKRLQTLRTRPKRLQNQIDTAKTDAERQKYQNTLDEVNKQIKYIEKQINSN